MSTRAQLSETLNRLLPGEQWKRVREGILQGANYSGNRTELLRKSIDEENRIKTGRLVEGIITITTPTTADISEWVWAIDFEIFQPAPVTALAILAPDATYPRPDYFVGTAAGIVEYRPSTIDSFGNSFPPTVDSDEVILRIIQRNPDESNTDVEPETVVPDFTDVLFHTAGTSNTIGKYAKIMEMNLGFAMDYSFTLDYGASATLAANKVGSLHVAFVCTEASVIHSPTVKLTTVGFSEAGDFVLVQLPDNKAALYHYSTNVEMRLQWRVLFKNWLMAISNFQSGNEYEALPAGTNWQSEVYGQGVKTVTGDGVGGTATDVVMEFPTPAEIGAQEELDSNIVAALEAANAPSGTNPFVTEADIPAPGISHGASDGKFRGSENGAWVEGQPLNKPPYGSQALMLADQAAQKPGFFYNDGTSTWAKLAASTGLITDYVKVGDVAPGGGGADTNAVHYNASDGKTASEKQQARDNIGSTAGIGQSISTTGNINDLSITSNYLKFTGGFSTILSGIAGGVDGQEIAITNFTGLPLQILGESLLSSANNRFKSPLILTFGSTAIIKYNTNDNRWYLIAGYFYGDTNGVRMDTKVGFGQVPLSNAQVRARAQTSDNSTAALYIDNAAGDRIFSAGGHKLIDIPGNLVVGGPTSIPITTYSFFVYAKGNTSSQGTIYLNNQSGVLLTVWDGAGDQRSVGGATFGVQRVPTGRVEIRGKGTSTLATLMMEGSGGVVNWRFRDNGTAQQTVKSSAFDEITRRDEQLLLYPITITTSGTVNDQAETAGNFNYYFTAATQINGFASGENGKVKIVQNNNSVNCIMGNENAGSIAANRLAIIGGSDLTVPPGGITEWIYLTTISRWRLKSKNF